MYNWLKESYTFNICIILYHVYNDYIENPLRNHYKITFKQQGLPNILNNWSNTIYNLPYLYRTV